MLSEKYRIEEHLKSKRGTFLCIILTTIMQNILLIMISIKKVKKCVDNEVVYFEQFL